MQKMVVSSGGGAAEARGEGGEEGPGPARGRGRVCEAKCRGDAPHVENREEEETARIGPGGCEGRRGGGGQNMRKAQSRTPIRAFTATLRNPPPPPLLRPPFWRLQRPGDGSAEKMVGFAGERGADCLPPPHPEGTRGLSGGKKMKFKKGL
ncbi:hypothetical protein H8959_000825 [Pygathrix nigripes]